MGLRFLFGPVSHHGTAIPRGEGSSSICLTFGPGGADLITAAETTWAEIEAQLPNEWRPDFLLVDLSEGTLADWRGSAPLPVIGVAPRTNRFTANARHLWQQYDRVIGGPLATSLIMTGELDAWNELRGLIEREWPSIAERSAARLARDNVGQLEWNLQEDPFDLESARAFFNALKESGEHRRARRFAHERRRLSAVAPELVPGESWFEALPPSDDRRASIVIVCCNQLEFTRGCVESVLRWTRRPFELILVDNGSIDETPRYLDQIRVRHEPDRVEVITNAGNRGFPAAYNRAIKRSRGAFIVLLNNNTVVSEGWLDGLIAWSLHDWPGVGLVGAVSNDAAAPQQVRCDYDVANLRGFDAFAARRRREFASRAVRLERLSGFCLLVRSEVFDRIGLFDEKVGCASVENDLCVRARTAGFQLLLALDVFVHNSESRTAMPPGTNCGNPLEEKTAPFDEVLGPACSASDQATSQPPEQVPARPKVSLCMIVRNEAENLPECLGCVSGLVDEMVVVDTGSTDGTRAIAERLGARVFDFPWIDDFAAARNESLLHATGEWIFWLDADDRLDEPEREKLRAFFASLRNENAAYVMKCLCPSEPGQASGTDTVVDHVRLFRNDPQVRWQYRVHEQVMPSLRRCGARIEWANATIRHVGYQDPVLRRAKLDRDIRLLERSLAADPNEPFVLFNLAYVYVEQERFADAIPVIKRSLARSHPADSIVRKLYALLVQCHRRLDQPTIALEACREGRAIYPNDVELLFQEGLILRGMGDYRGAEERLKELLQSREADHFASIDAGLRGYKARHNLAVLYQDQGRFDEAIAQWQAVTAERPDFMPAWLGLAELYLAGHRWDELDVAILRLRGGPQTDEESAIFKARALLKQKKFDAARAALEQPLARNPAALKPRVILSHILLQEGRDNRAAEAALRAILAIDPSHAEARHNLAVLLSKMN
jgi:glycosyltransferase involved in cell wall biosynthesis